MVEVYGLEFFTSNPQNLKPLTLDLTEGVHHE